jgi:uncharacterized protein (TIGR02757 family)
MAQRAMISPPHEAAARWADFLREKALKYESRDFIPDDPVAIPHRYAQPRDQELAGFLTALIAWGNRKSILHSAEGWMGRMDDAPYAFVRSASRAEWEGAMSGWCHRTMSAADAVAIGLGLQGLLREWGSLEAAFAAGFPAAIAGATQRPLTGGAPVDTHGAQMQAAWGRFHDLVFAGSPPGRERKHVADPRRGAAAKRLNMFLRWMVRSPARGVDLGIWTQVRPSQLMMPLDVHTANVGRKLGLLERRANDWRAVEELTAALRVVDPEDPVRLDFALFGLGAIEGF